MDDLDENQIDSLKLPQAIKTAKKFNIKLGDLKTLEDVRCVLKRDLLKDKLTRSSVIEGLTISADIDAGHRKCLCDVFSTVIECTNGLIKRTDPLIEKLHQSFPKFEQLLVRQKVLLEGKTSKCPILVLGETGAGKSSFINLLLGEDVLPCSLLSNTNVISEIMYHEEPFAVLYPKDDHKIEIEKITFSKDTGMKVFLDELSKKIQKSEGSDSTRGVYKKAEIYLPQDILKTGITIVDSPGIGDTEEMTNMVLDYILEACAFVYIINSANAGGVQTDRLQSLLKKVYEKAFVDQKDYRPECALFICNKWDQVPYNEREDVYRDTKEKLTGRSSGWPDCKTDQIIKLSTREASFIQKSGFIVGQYYNIVLKINELVPLSREILILNSYRLIVQFLRKALFCIEADMQEATLAPVDREKLAKETVESLRLLQKEVREFFEKQKKYLSSEINKVSKQLSKYFQDKDVINEICDFEEGLIKARDWKETMIQVRSTVCDRLSENIQKWENKNQEFEKVGEKISTEFKEKFPDFDDKLSNLENKFTGSGRENRSIGEIGYVDESFVPLNVKQKFGSLSLGLKVLVGISFSPVFLLGAIVRLPVWGVKELKRVFDSHLLEKTYHKNEKMAARKYAEITLNAMVDSTQLVPLMEKELVPLFNYLDTQKNKVLRQIDVEVMLIERQEDRRHQSEQILATYDPIHRQFQRFMDKTRLFELGYFERPHIEIPSTCIEIDISIDGIISDGVLAMVMKARSLDLEKTESHREVVVRKSKIEVDDSEIDNYLKEENAYKLMKKPHIVRLLGLLKDTRAQVKQVFMPLHCNLRHAVEQGIMDSQTDSECFIVIEQVVQGLKFLNDKHFVHHDLSLDTIMIDYEKRVKLTSIQKPKILPASFFPLDSKDIAKFVHFPHEIISTPSQTLYEHKHDMYSVGIMMYEIIHNERAYKKQLDTTTSQIVTLKDFVEYARQGNKLWNNNEGSLSKLVPKIWIDISMNCLEYKADAGDMLQWLIQVYRNYSTGESVEQINSTMSYCLIK